mgnify:CR=1 FL=1
MTALAPSAHATAPGTDPVRLRAAVPADLDAIAAIERIAFTDPWSREAFAQLVRGGRALFLVADEAAAGAPPAPPLGYLVAWFVLDEGEIANVAVAPAARGRGIGARLVDAALTESARRGATHLFLEVRESNAVARRLYASRGFVEVGRRRRYYRSPVEDALVLRCDLPDAARDRVRGAG